MWKVETNLIPRVAAHQGWTDPARESMVENLHQLDIFFFRIHPREDEKRLTIVDCSKLKVMSRRRSHALFDTPWTIL
jgi:hypothetical protein